MLSQTADYALRAVVFLADNPETSLTTQQIAQVTKVPSGYLSKVLQALGKANLVQAQRGLHGGFVLRRDPARISVLDVINSVDPLQRIRECPLGIGAHGPHLCPLHRRLDDAMAMIEQAFGGSTIADLLNDPNSSKPLCDVSSEKNKLSVELTVGGGKSGRSKAKR